MLEVMRICKNVDDDPVRIDSIVMEPMASNLVLENNKITYLRRLNTQLIVSSGSRVVDSIEIITTGDTVDGVNYAYVYWTKRSVPVQCNMSDLPKIGDTV